MNEMVERAATAIMNRRVEPDFYGVDEHGVCLFDTDAELARAAIEAMREPTAVMVDAGASAYAHGLPEPAAPWGIRDAWCAMIDEALIELGPVIPAGSADLHGVPRAEE